MAFGAVRGIEGMTSNSPRNLLLHEVSACNTASVRARGCLGSERRGQLLFS